jgi:hypothetical protein
MLCHTPWLVPLWLRLIPTTDESIATITIHGDELRYNPVWLKSDSALELHGEIGRLLWYTMTGDADLNKNSGLTCNELRVFPPKFGNMPRAWTGVLGSFGTTPERLVLLQNLMWFTMDYLDQLAGLRVGPFAPPKLIPALEMRWGRDVPDRSIAPIPTIEHAVALGQGFTAQRARKGAGSSQFVEVPETTNLPEQLAQANGFVEELLALKVGMVVAPDMRVTRTFCRWALYNTFAFGYE